MKRLSLWTFERERSAGALNHINNELRVLPVFLLRLANVERAASNVPQVHITRSHGDFTWQKAVCSAVVATSP